MDANSDKNWYQQVLTNSSELVMASIDTIDTSAAKYRYYRYFFLVFTTFLLGRSRSGAPFWDSFSISVALSLGVVLRLSNITSGGSEVRVVGRNTRRK